MAAVMGALMIPFIVLNMLGGIVGGVWLAVMGRWDLVAAGAGCAILGPIAVSIALLPSLIFVGPIAWAADRDNIVVGGFFALLNLLWTYAVMLASAVFVFLYVTRDVGYSDPVWPFILLAYGAATSPWAFLAQKDLQAGNDNAAVPLFFLQVSCVVIGLLIAFQDQRDWQILALCGGAPLALGLLTQLMFLAALSRRRAF